MADFSARLRNGAFVLDNADSEDDAPLHLVVEDEGDELDADDRARLEAAIEATFATDPSTWRSVDEVLAELRTRFG